MKIDPREPCPVCGEPGMGKVSHCTRCGAQLPWLGVEYGIVKNTPPRYPSRLMLWYERTLESWGLLPSRTLTCRYCDAAIAEDTQVCTNCGRSLVAHRHHDKRHL